MKQRRIYLYLKNPNFGDIISFLSTYEHFSVNVVNDHILEVLTDEHFHLDMLEKARNIIMVELYRDITAFVVPLGFDFKIYEILVILPKLNRGIYTIEALIYEIVMLGEKDLISKFKSYYYNRFSPETIETILGFIDENMNASKTAKALYMHRNTLNYRLDNFISRTEIDVRSFKGALAIYLLFKK